MSIPSSPPPLPEELFNDPPSSPALPPANYLPANYSTRKRHADYYDSSLSSDPIFSEDASEDSDPNGGLKKKKYTKGPWFQHAHTPLPFHKAVAPSAHNADSGVWMGSDSSTDSISGCNKRVQTLSFQEYSVRIAPAAAPRSKAQTPDQIAAAIVFQNVEACQQTTDLSEMRLRTIPNDVLRPLHQLIRLTVDVNDTQKITPDHYAPLTPEIKLFLAKNELTSLPSELWNLGNLAVLSLRNNDLTDIPPFIARLRNLQELNVAGNHLESLPWELLNLLLPTNRKLNRFSLSPNPFLQPFDKRPPAVLGRLRLQDSPAECVRNMRRIRSSFPDSAARDCTYEALLVRVYETRLHQLTSTHAASPTSPTSAAAIDNGARPIYVASSKASFLDCDGSLLRSPMSSFSRTEPSKHACLTPTPLPAETISAAPSLLELSARACARSPFINQLTSLLPEDASPPVTRTLAKAIRSKEIGLQGCSVCRKQYVVPRAEWLEFWFDGHGSGEQFLPFVRRTCSWKCVQRLQETRAAELVDIQDAVARVESALDGAMEMCT